MTRYIDIDLLLNEIEIDYSGYIFSENRSPLEFINIIENQPTADVKEVVRGEWIDVDGNDEHYKCSICNKTINGNSIPYYFNFCHKCGADMRELEEND